MIEVADGVWIHERELKFTAARSRGPGGQNVNKVSTRVTLRFDVAASPRLTLEQKSLILERLAGRISKDGVLRVSSQLTRRQAANRRAALRRLVELLAEALTGAPPRQPTRIPEASRRRRMEDKKRRGRLKRLRSRPIEVE